VQRKVDGDHVALDIVKNQRESHFRGSQEAHRESQTFIRSSPSGSSGREASSKTKRKVSLVEEAG
jgi:hypothetical protein